MRGLARHGRSLDGQPAGLKSLRGPIVSRKLTPPYVSLSRCEISTSFPLARSSQAVSHPVSASFLLLVFVFYVLFPCLQRMEVVCSRAVRLEVALPCTWIPIYAQIPDSSWPRKYLDAGVSRILFLRGKPRYQGTFPKRGENINECLLSVSAFFPFHEKLIYVKFENAREKSICCS